MERTSRDDQLQADKVGGCQEAWNLNLLSFLFELNLSSFPLLPWLESLKLRAKAEALGLEWAKLAVLPVVEAIPDWNTGLQVSWTVFICLRILFCFFGCGCLVPA